MTQDFAKKPKASSTKKKQNGANKKKPRPKSQVPGWVWLFTGIVTGIFLCFLAYLADITPAPKPADSKAVASKSEPANEPDNNTTRFDFYTLLPEREVIVPEEQTRPDAKPQESYIYILQAGSFKSAADADRLRAKLILLGLDTKVEAVSGKGSGTWHRVQVGPFSSRSKLSAARNTLISEGIETLLLKRKAET